jgi:hypothetical protein
MKKALIVAAGLAAAGCDGGKEKPVVPTEIQQPPGPDSEGGKKKPADAGKAQKQADG